jgi:hypothetical protein
MQTFWHRAEAYIPIVRVARVFCLSERSVFCIAQDCFDTTISFPCINRLKQKGYKIQRLTLKRCISLTAFICAFRSLLTVIVSSIYRLVFVTETWCVFCET